MGKKNKPVSAEKIRFSIGAKLKLIISLIVIISLGSITALASWLIHNDLRLSAEDNNKEINSYSVADEILKFHDLKEKGIITSEEFEKKKKQLLDL